MLLTEQERLSEFDLKLMDIDSEHLGIPGELRWCVSPQQRVVLQSS